MRSLVPFLFFMLLASGCQRNPPPQPVQEYQMRGEVMRIDPLSQTATVKHGKIDGWMEAMTMEYPVKGKQDLAALRVGEKIRAKVLVQGANYWIDAVAEDK